MLIYLSVEQIQHRVLQYSDPIVIYWKENVLTLPVKEQTIILYIAWFLIIIKIYYCV